MGLFDKLKKLVSDDSSDTGGIEIFAPLSGEIVPIEDVPDVVFAEKIVGDGIAIKPAGNKMVAPCDGTIGKIFETNHAFSLESDSGIELFVHFGIDTVELKGEGFTRIAQEGQQVKRGDTIIEFNLAVLEAKAKSTLTPVVISNMDEIKELIKMTGAVTVGETRLSVSRSNARLAHASCCSKKPKPGASVFLWSRVGFPFFGFFMVACRLPLLVTRLLCRDDNPVTALFLGLIKGPVGHHQQVVDALLPLHGGTPQTDSEGERLPLPRHVGGTDMQTRQPPR